MNVQCDSPLTVAFPHPPGIGGPGSFQIRIEKALVELGWRIAYADELADSSVDVVMVVGGTRKLRWLHQMKRKGVPILHRLDGLLWIHRAQGLKINPRKWISSEARNLLAKWIHAYLAETVVYQSHFVRSWWKNQGWVQPKHWRVIHNGIDLDHFRPTNTGEYDSTPPDVICVEGHIDYSPYAIPLLNAFADHIVTTGAKLIVCGGFADAGKKEELSAEIDYRGLVSRDQVAEVYRNRIYLTLDVNPACPNAVAEAMASGAPVIGFDTGAVRELVGDDSGCIVEFGADSWAGEWPVFDNLNAAYDRASSEYVRLSRNARQRAIHHFDIELVVRAYITIFEQMIGR